MAEVFNCRCGSAIIADSRLQKVVHFPDGRTETYCRRDCPCLPGAIDRAKAANYAATVKRENAQWQRAKGVVPA